MFFPPFSDFSLLLLSCPFLSLLHPVLIPSLVLSLFSFMSCQFVPSSSVMPPCILPQYLLQCPLPVVVFPMFEFSLICTLLLPLFGCYLLTVFLDILAWLYHSALTTTARFLFPSQSCLPCVVCIWVLALFNGLS